MNIYFLSTHILFSIKIDVFSEYRFHPVIQNARITQHENAYRAPARDLSENFRTKNMHNNKKQQRRLISIIETSVKSFKFQITEDTNLWSFHICRNFRSLSGTVKW